MPTGRRKKQPVELFSVRYSGHIYAANRTDITKEVI